MNKLRLAVPAALILAAAVAVSGLVNARTGLAQDRMAGGKADLNETVRGEIPRQNGNSLPSADTSSPRATLQSFIDSCNEFYRTTNEDKHFDRRSPFHRPVVRRILDCLNTSGLAGYADNERASEAAVCLKESLDRLEIPPLDEIPDIAAIEAAGGPDDLPRWTIPGTRITIARAEEGPQKHEYLFTPGSLDRAIDNYEETAAAPYRMDGPATSPGLHDWFVSAPGHPIVGDIVMRLPPWWKNRVGGLALWQWFGIALAIAATAIVMFLAYHFQHMLASRWGEGAAYKYCFSIVFSIAAAVVPLAFKSVVERSFTVRGTPLYVLTFIADAIVLAGLVVVIIGLGDRIAALIIASPKISAHGLNAQLIRVTCKIGSLIGATIVILEGGQYLGIPVTTLLASAGIGGLAIALAAQDALKSLFGTIMLLADKPFRVGERIVAGGYDGVVEDIGLRSTKIRLLTGHLANIPNDELARKDIENVGRRPYIRRKATIEMPSDTPVADVKEALRIVRSAVENHEGMMEDRPPQVYLRDMNESSIGIIMFYWYYPANYWDYLALSERVNLEIMDKLERAGIPFAAPALTVHAVTDEPIDDPSRNGLSEFTNEV